MNKKQPPKNPQWFNLNGIFLGLLMLLLINSLLYPNFAKPVVKDSDYGTFVSEINQGKVSKVNFKDGYIYYAIPAVMIAIL